MNTSKQVNLMLGLLFLVVLGFGLYFVWDQNERAPDAAQKQVRDNADRGAFLFARNCRVCHGITGAGTLENVNLPGLPLDLEANRPKDPSELKLIQARFRDTIECGRVGTLMPPWHTSQGGPLNDFQIQQLVTLITGATGDIGPPAVDNELISQEAWEGAVEFAEEADTLRTPKGETLQLTKPVTVDGTTIILNSVIGLARDTFLRLDNPDPESPPEKDEVVRVVQVPATTELTSAALKEDSSVIVKDASAFREGMVIAIDNERMRVVSIQEPNPPANVQARAALAGVILVPTRVQVERGVDDTRAAYHKPAAAVADTNTQIVVERGAFGTGAVAQAQGTQVFAGPIPPPRGPLTGEAGTPPCGQRAAAATPTATPSGPPRTPGPGGELTIAMIPTIRFDTDTLSIPAGQAVKVLADNKDTGVPHDFAVYKDESAKDLLGKTDICTAPCEGAVTLNLAAGEYFFRCDVHPTQMTGKLVVQ